MSHQFGIEAAQLNQLEGLPLIPVKNIGGDKRPYKEDWKNNPYTPEGIAGLNGECQMVGVRLDKLLAVADIDGPNAIADWKEQYGVDLGLLPRTWMTASGRPGRKAYIYKAPSQEQLDRIEDAGLNLKTLVSKTDRPIPDPENDPVESDKEKFEGIDLRFCGQQVVLGKHPSPKGLFYQWVDGSSPADIAECPDVLIDAYIAYCSNEGKSRRFSGNRVLVEEWWTLTDAERLTRIGKRFLPTDEGKGEQAWFHICSVMKACVDHYGIDEGVALEAFIAFSKRAPGFKGEDDCEAKWVATTPGEFEDPLGLLVKACQRGNRLMLPPKHDGDKGSSPVNTVLMSTEEVRQILQEAADEDVTGAELAEGIAQLSQLSGLTPFTIKDIHKAIVSDAAAELDRKDAAAAIEQTRKYEAEIRQLDMTGLIPDYLVEALRATAKGMPYCDYTLLLNFLLTCSSSVKLGTKVAINKVTKFVVPMNLYTCMVGESGIKKTPLSQAMISRPTAGIRQKLAEEYEAAEYAYKNAKRGKKPPEPLPQFIQINDWTGEALNQVIQANHKALLPLLIWREELKALFDSLGVYKAGGSGSGGEEEMLLELFDGHEHTSIRTKGVRHYPESHVSLGGCIQQGVLCLLLQSNEDANGKWARVLFFPLEGMPVMLPDDSDPDAVRAAAAADETLRNIVTALHCLRPRTYECTQEAKEWFRDYELAKQEERSAQPATSLRSLINKHCGKVPRIAGLLMLLEHIKTGFDRATNEMYGLQETEDVQRKVELKHLKAAARLVQLSDDWTCNFHEGVASGSKGQTVSAVDAIQERIQEVALKAADWMTWRSIKENLTPAQRSEYSSERGKQVLATMAAAGMGETKLGPRGGMHYRAFKEGRGNKEG